MRSRTQRALLELLLLMSSAGCQRSPTPGHTARASTSSALAPSSQPPLAERFVCRGGDCRQAQPRLPDTGEWRCAERDAVVWCAGGEPAAAVVPGNSDPHFRCGARWRDDTGERICIDIQPEYPADDRQHYRCRFEQERRIRRVCQPTAPQPQLPLAARALPACWLDRDCPSGTCDRGACTCTNDSACIAGSCEQGHCAEAAR